MVFTMKKKINRFLNWFEDHFNYYIEILAFIGGLFCIVFSVVLFLLLIFDQEIITDSAIGIVLLPGIIGFFGVMILFALRITRHLTAK